MVRGCELSGRATAARGLRDLDRGLQRLRDKYARLMAEAAESPEALTRLEVVRVRMQALEAAADECWRRQLIATP